MLYCNVRIMGAHLRLIDAATVGLVSAGTWSMGARIEAWSWSSTWQAAAVFSSTVVVVCMAAGDRLGAYHAGRTKHVTSELSALLEVIVYAMGVSCAATEVLTPGLPGRAYATLFAATAIVLLGLRVAMRGLIRSLRRKGKDARIWLIVGHNGRTMRLLEEIRANPHFGIRIDEVVDLPARPEMAPPKLGASRLPTSIRSRVVPGIDAIRKILAGRVIDEVVVTLPLRSHYDEVQEILRVCRDAGISVKLPSAAFNPAGDRTQVSQIGTVSVVTHFTGPASHRRLLIKRAMDVVGAAVGFVMLFPIFVVVAASVKLSSPGPVFFRQKRVGLHGRHFQMIKFRSMVRDAAERREELGFLNETDGTAFKMKDDPRMTRVGTTLRRFHLDELPQLWNVLVGDMSLVGPRPLPPQEAHGNEWWQRRRLSMPPGLTCLWQVQGDVRMPFRQWMELDLDYIDHWSVRLDLKLIAATFATIVRGSGW